LKTVRISIVLAVFAIAAGAAERPEESWNRRIGETVAHLKQGEPARARGTIDAVLHEIAADANPGRSAHKALAMGLTLRAIAEATLGNEGIAAWDFQAAQQIDPAFETWDMSEFGVAGATVAKHRLALDPPPHLEPTGPEDPETTAPKFIGKRPFPAYFARARERGWQGQTKLTYVIAADGSVSHPRVAPMIAESGILFEIFEFNRGARYEPATRAGKPVPLLYTVNLKFTSK
jgi:hypothetical protein